MIKYGTNNIGKIYFGSNLIGKAYFGSDLVYSSGSGPGPQPVTNVAYIRGGANGSYIDTGITADNTVKVIVWARNWLPYSEGLFGSRTAAGSGEFAIAATSGADVDRARIRFGTSNTAFAENAITEVYSHYHKYEYSEGVFKVDDVVKATATTQTFNNNLNIHLFGINTGGTHTLMNFPADIHACKIYKAGVLVRDFTAVNTPSVGLYDSVSETMFTNAGAGSFAYGSFDTNAYTAVEYIGCSGEQYFDTGLVGSYDIPIVVSFMPTGTLSQTMFLFGARTSSSSGRCEVQMAATTPMYKHFAFCYKTKAILMYENSVSQVDSDIVFVKSNNTGYLYKNSSQLGATATGDSGAFTTSYNMFVGECNMAGTPNYGFYGRIYYAGFGPSRNFVPAKQGASVGMYDTYNDVFYPSETATAFVAGNEL